MKISCHFNGFWKNKKWWKFSMIAALQKKCDFLTFHVCRFSSHMSELFHFSCPEVIFWWFPAILRAFEKFKKIEVFADRGPAEICRFWTFHTFADFAAKWVNSYILGVLMSYYDDFLPFLGLLKKLKNLEFYDDRGHAEKCDFFLFFTCLQPNEWIITF